MFQRIRRPSPRGDIIDDIEHGERQAYPRGKEQPAIGAVPVAELPPRPIIGAISKSNWANDENYRQKDGRSVWNRR